MELSLADVLDGLISWPGSGQCTRVQFRVRELQANGTSRRSTSRNPCDARSCSPARKAGPSDTIAAWLPTFSAAAKRGTVPAAMLQGTSSGDPTHVDFPTASRRGEGPVYLGDRAGGGAQPIPGSYVTTQTTPAPTARAVHMRPILNIAVGRSGPGHRHQLAEASTTGSSKPPRRRAQFDGEPGPASHVEQPVPASTPMPSECTSDNTLGSFPAR